MSNVSDFIIENGVLKKYVGPGGGVEIPGGITTIGGYSFHQCDGVTSISIPDSVTIIESNAFSYCHMLKSISIPDSVTTIERMAFYNCGNLTSISLPDSITKIGDSIFSGCSKLKSISLPRNVTEIGNNAFFGCNKLKTISIPDSVTKIGRGSFQECKSLSSIFLSENVTILGDCVFAGCKGLADEQGFVVVRDVLYGYFGNEIDLFIPNSVTAIGESAFSGCNKLKSILIPDSVTTIGGNAFSGCNKLENISISESVTTVGHGAFAGCGSLTNISLPAGLKKINFGMFQNCYALASVVINGNVTEISDNVFDKCKRLADFTIPSALADRLSEILPKGVTPVLHIESIADISAKYRPGAAVGFAEDNRDCTDENGKAYLKYIKANADKLAPLACEHPALLYLMIQKKLIAAKHLDAVSEAVQASGNTELIAAMLEYGGNSVSDKDKAKVRAKKEEREENVTSFIFNAEKVEMLSGKAIVVTGKLKTFTSRDELKECLEAVGAVLTETLAPGVDYLLTNTPNSGTAKNKKAEELGVQKITEQEFNDLIGRHRK